MCLDVTLCVQVGHCVPEATRGDKGRGHGRVQRASSGRVSCAPMRSYEAGR